LEIESLSIFPPRIKRFNPFYYFLNELVIVTLPREYVTKTSRKLRRRFESELAKSIQNFEKPLKMNLSSLPWRLKFI